jgi:phenylacetate-coenzyme A ligase PaaK-like adenylate-forming protein
MKLHSQLQALYERAVSSPYSNFYRERLTGQAPATYAEWQMLPLLTKSDIARVPFYERIFIPWEEVDLVRLTSGTSASGVLAVPRARMSYTPAEARLMPVDRYMGFLLPHRIYDNYTRPGASFVGGDPARLAHSARLAARMEIEGIGALPSTLIAFAEELQNVYDIRRIKHLCFNGERCTSLQRSALARLYPGASSMVSSYGSSETQGLCAVTTAYPGHEDALLGHPLVHYEIIDDNAAVIHGAGEGELVVSLLYEKAAFPLLRYRTGDRVLMMEQSDERTVFSVRGRAVLDRVRFAGGILLAAELERAIGAVSKGAVADFEATVTEESPDNPRIRLSIALIVPPLYRETLGRDVAAQIENELRVSEDRTYADAVMRGICAPLTCTVEDLNYRLGYKRHRLRDARAT